MYDENKGLAAEAAASLCSRRPGWWSRWSKITAPRSNFTTKQPPNKIFNDFFNRK